MALLGHLDTVADPPAAGTGEEHPNPEPTGTAEAPSGTGSSSDPNALGVNIAAEAASPLSNVTTVGSVPDDDAAPSPEPAPSLVTVTDLPGKMALAAEEAAIATAALTPAPTVDDAETPASETERVLAEADGSADAPVVDAAAVKDVPSAVEEVPAPPQTPPTAGADQAHATSPALDDGASATPEEATPEVVTREEATPEVVMREEATAQAVAGDQAVTGMSDTAPALPDIPTTTSPEAAHQQDAASALLPEDLPTSLSVGDHVTTVPQMDTSSTATPCPVSAEAPAPAAAGAEQNRTMVDVEAGSLKAMVQLGMAEEGAAAVGGAEGAAVAEEALQAPSVAAAAAAPNADGVVIASAVREQGPTAPAPAAAPVLGDPEAAAPQSQGSAAAGKGAEPTVGPDAKEGVQEVLDIPTLVDTSSQVRCRGHMGGNDVTRARGGGGGFEPEPGLKSPNSRSAGGIYV